jgi:hypothetical protein
MRLLRKPDKSRLDKMVDCETRRCKQDAINIQETTSVLIHSLEFVAVLIPPIPPSPRHPSDEPLEATSKKSEGVRLKRVAAHVLKQPRGTLVEPDARWQDREVVSTNTPSGIMDLMP